MTTASLSLQEIETLTTQVFVRNGCDPPNTRALVRTIVAAEQDGSASHGLFRVPGYIASLRSGKVNGRARPFTEHKTPVVLHLNGDNGFAPLALELGVPLLAQAAKRFGVAVLTLTHSHHFAALWPETEAIASLGLIGVACVSYLSCVAPYGGNKPLFGTNPISFAWPRPGKFPIVVDMATSSMALGDVQIAAREGREVPLGTGLDGSSRPTTDAAEILKGVLLPFGGHKGSALALMVELLAAGATGDRFSYEAAEKDNRDGGPSRGGEFVLAVSPELLSGRDWAERCERFFQRFDAIEGARLPGLRRYRNRQSSGARDVDKGLLMQIRALCD